ncbi:hypothetical protein K2173_007674 [Erythroxylum novogranatense]|uniref:Fe2OG dioxygenase domain-containing protein n=1 Tax=Erythroxylum novogranatense TaxID=1862640 RepID=A0AAV8TV67_9ROSI|nr:hypothetical protein K2173_007674 [Erythroxylum novogranatense]
MKLDSLPPVFRDKNTSEESIVLDKEIEEDDDVVIPVIDLENPNPEKIGGACKDWGMFRLVNHGVPLNILTQLQDHSRDLFSLSFERKQSLFTTPLSYFWGTPALTPSGTALTGVPRNMNWVEGLNIPLGLLAEFGAADNAKLHSFRVLIEEYGGHLAKLASTVFEVMAKNLNLNPQHSKSYLSESTGFVRVYRYPQCSMARESWGMDVHTDSSVISILFQDQVGGLELLKDDKWLKVKPIPHTLILNLGDMMQAISNDEYKSVKHRVKLNKWDERLSICYFVFPAEGGVIQSSKYKPFTYSDFQAQVQQDIKALGYKVGLDKFRVG